MDVLQVTPYSVHPPANGGEHRMHGLMIGRGENDTVRRFAKSSYSTSQIKKDIDDRYCEFRYTSLLESIPMYLTGLMVDVPSIYTSWIMSATRPEKLREFIDTSDIVVVEHPWQFKYVYEISDCDTPVVYSSHNFEPELYAEFQDSLYTKPLYKTIRKLEQFAVSESALTIVTSQRDEDHYRRAFDVSGPFHVAPNAAYLSSSDCSATNPTVSVKENFSVCFVGSDHDPNLDAVELIKSYAKQLPDVAFFVIGSVCSGYDSKSMPDNVYLEGFVDSLNGYYRNCDVALNPIRTGSGSNVKMPEYFASGLPVITTPFGTRGIQGEPGVHYVVCGEQEFPEKIKYLRDRSKNLNTIGENARELVETFLNWDTVSKRLFDELRKLKTE